MSESLCEPASDSPRDAGVARVQCPNCCRMAPVVATRSGLLFYECELCGTSGATVAPEALENVQQTR